MCAGAAMMFQVKRVIIGENKNMSGREELLRDNGVEVVVLNDHKCEEMMTKFIEEQPNIW